MIWKLLLMTSFWAGVSREIGASDLPNQWDDYSPTIILSVFLILLILLTCLTICQHHWNRLN